jgi:hypothetical protein
LFKKDPHSGGCFAAVFALRGGACEVDYAATPLISSSYISLISFVLPGFLAGLLPELSSAGKNPSKILDI